MSQGQKMEAISSREFMKDSALGRAEAAMLGGLAPAKVWDAGRNRVVA